MTGAHWAWIARPEFYLTNGKDRPDLDPARGYDPEGWWTCHPETRSGDLAVLYRSQERKDIGYLIAVRSDAEALDDPGGEFDGWHVCRYQILARFERPVTIAEMRSDPVLSTWTAVKVAFVRRAFPVPDEVWDALFARLGVNAEELQQKLITGDRRFRLERDLQEWLLNSGGEAFRRLGWSMDLVRHEYPCGTGRADLLYRQAGGRRGRDVVVELKRAMIGQEAVDQVIRYRDFLDRHERDGRRRCTAILVGESLDDAAERAVRSDHRLTFVSIADLQATTSA